MSDTQTYEAVTVASDGVTVTKRFEADEFPVPAIAFNFESRRSEPVTVHLSDVVPDDVAVEDLGFHPEYGSEYWTIDDDEISFEREIEPDTEYTTVYGIRATGTDNVEQFLTEPQFDEVDPPLEDDEGALVGDGSDAVKDVISGDADSVPGLDDVDDEDIETLDLKDPNGEGPAQTTDSDDGGDDESESADESSTSDGDATENATSVELSGDSLVAALADELRNQNVTKDDVKLLRKAFDLASEDDGSVQARVRKLQQDVTDVIAYTDALEEFLDENGTGGQMVEEFRSEVSEFRDQVEEFDSELGEVQNTASANEEQISSISSDFGDVESSVDDVEATVDDLESRLEELTGELETVRDEMGDGDVDEKIEGIHDEIEELKEWREQLSSVIGGGE